MLDRQKVDGSRERYVLTGMVFSSTVLGKLSSLPERFWESKAAKVIDSLCCRCFEKSGKAPKESIRAVARAWAEKGRDDSLVRQVGEAIELIQSQCLDGKVNSGHCIDEAMDFFNGVRVEQAIEKAQGYVRLGKTKEAFQTMASLNEIDAGTSTIREPFNDPSVVDIMFTEKPEPMIQFDGGLGRFYGHLLRRGAFVSFIAAEGVGKSQFLWDLAFNAVLQRLRVTYLQVGDMEEEEILYRMASRTARHPWYSTREENPRWPCDIKWPTKLGRGGVESKTIRFEKPMTPDRVREVQKEMQTAVRSKECYLKLSIHPNDTINVAGVKDVLRNLDRTGFVSDVVVLDYADNLLPPAGMMRAEPREQMNRSWSQLRGLCMERKCLLATATQCRRLKESEVDNPNFVLLPDYISEEKRKIGAVTAMFGINQTNDEKEQEIYRLNKLKARNMKFNKRRVCHVASCLAVSHPTVLSWYPEYVPQLKER